LVRRHDDRRANVAITFAFASLPILGFVAAAVDYSRANSVKAAMQTALDSTALMLAKEAATDTEDQLKANALKYFTAVFARPEAKDILVNVTYTTAGGSKIVVNATAAMDAEFTKLLGYDTYHINASSTAKWGTRRLRVALVLDNTGSMADAGKMAALKTATKGLLSQLQGAVTQPGDVYVSIVPFVKDVNLGASNWNANWIYWGSSTQDPGETDNTSWEPLLGTCDSNSTYNNDRNRCRTRGGVCSNTSFTRQSTCTTNGTCSVGSPTSQSTCESRGTCSVGRSTTQTACNSAGTCSLAGYTTQTGCQNAGICDISGFTTQSTCQNARHCSIGGWSTRTQCQNQRRHLAARCLDLDPRIVDPRDLDPCDLYRVHLDAGHLDACEPQYVERLRDGSRQLGWSRRDVQLRHNVRRAGSSHAAVVVAVPRRAVRVLPAGREAIE
jgi:Flp pilus assembly protein TadG